MPRNIYRKWYDPEEWAENFLLIYPTGLMLQISFEKERDDYGENAVIYQTNRSNRVGPEMFIKHKKASTKKEFEEARKRAMHLLTGKPMTSKVKCSTMPRLTYIIPDKDRANAHVIAAAPDLLAAPYDAAGGQYDDGKPITLADNLRELASMIEAGHNLQAEPNWIQWLKLQAATCDTAVAKATGNLPKHHSISVHQINTP
jgi:hypothetical protein